MTRFLQEFPWTRDGLSRTERRLLHLAEGEGFALRNFHRLHDGESAYYATDASVADMAANLSRSSPPLVTLDTSGSNGDGLGGTVALTETGRSVLAGRLDRVAACGIDRWLGGVHLQRDGPMWRWDEARQRVTL